MTPGKMLPGVIKKQISIDPWIKKAKINTGLCTRKE
jgi:hypothetical protein